MEPYYYDKIVQMLPERFSQDSVLTVSNEQIRRTFKELGNYHFWSIPHQPLVFGTHDGKAVVLNGPNNQRNTFINMMYLVNGTIVEYNHYGELMNVTKREQDIFYPLEPVFKVTSERNEWLIEALEMIHLPIPKHLERLTSNTPNLKIAQA